MRGQGHTLLLAVSLVVSLAASIQAADLVISGEVRLRAESQNNFNDKYYGTNPTKGVEHDNYLLSRVRIGVDYDFSDEWHGKFSVQDSRAIGWALTDDDWYNKEYDMIHNPQQDVFELSLTYLQYTPKGSGLGFKVGRQKIAYGDNRVFGLGEGRNSGKFWDAVKFSYKTGEHWVDFFYGRTMLHDPEVFSFRHRHGYIGAGLYGHLAYKTFAFEPIVVYKYNNDGNLKYQKRTTYYYGARFYDTNVHGFFYDMTYIKAEGEQTTLEGTKVDVAAYGYHAEAGYHFVALPGKPKVGIGYTYATGNDANTSDIERFDGVFGANGLYGRMELMKWGNLKDQELYVKIKPMKRVQCRLGYHRLNADEASDQWMSYKIPGMRADHYGDEIDLLVTVNVNKSLKVMTGVSYFIPGDWIAEAATKRSSITDECAFLAFAQVKYLFTSKG